MNEYGADKMKGMELERLLINHIHGLKFEDLPPSVVQQCKRLTLDSLGVVFPGALAPGSAEVADLVESWKGLPTSNIFTRLEKVSPPSAALVNSTMMHALDFDDTLDASALHTFVTILPAAMATAQACGNVDGKRFITALVAGVDIICRISAGIKSPLSWIRTATCGCFGAAAAAGKILELNRAKLQHALGIAYSQASGNAQGLVEGRLVKRMQPAFAAKNGTLSAYLAKSNITGASQFLTGDYGFYNLYEKGEYDPDRVTENAGKHFWIEDLSIKPYPCCRMTHSSIEAALKLKAKISDINNIQTVEVAVSQMVKDMVGMPFVPGENPQVSAQFSIPYTVSTALIKGDVFLEDFEMSAISDEQRNALARKVEVSPDKGLADNDIHIARISLLTSGGKIFHCEVATPPGNPENPLSEELVKEKFCKCVRYKRNGIREDELKRFIETVDRLEELDDVSKMVEMMNGILL